MKVLVLGGAGHVGRPAAEILATSDLVSEVVVGGRDLERAERAAGEPQRLWAVGEAARG